MGATKMVEAAEKKVTQLEDVHENARKHKDKHGKSVWKFLYENTDHDLIAFTNSEEEEKDLKKSELNIITEVIQIIEAKPDTSLGQVAIWFFQIARAWPKNVRVNEESKALIEGLLRRDFLDSAESPETEDEEMKNLVEYNGTNIEFNEETIAKNGDGSGGQKNMTQDGQVLEIVQVMNDIMDDHGIKGKAATNVINEALESPQTLEEWHKLLTFVLAVAESTPVMEDYVYSFKHGNNFSLKRLIIAEEENPELFQKMLKKAANLLDLLEKACEEHPLVSKLLRASFFEYLLNSDDSDDEMRR